MIFFFLTLIGKKSSKNGDILAKKPTLRLIRECGPHPNLKKKQNLGATPTKITTKKKNKFVVGGGVDFSGWVGRGRFFLR